MLRIRGGGGSDRGGQQGASHPRPVGPVCPEDIARARRSPPTAIRNKQLIRPVRGFKAMKTAYATINGFEVMWVLRKEQARAFALPGGALGISELRWK